MSLVTALPVEPIAAGRVRISTQLVARAMPHMRKLAERTRETIKFGILSTSQVLVVAA